MADHIHEAVELNYTACEITVCEDAMLKLSCNIL